MNQRHKHYDCIVAWANGEEIQMLSGDIWVSVPEHPKWHEINKYRIKPKRVKKEGWVNVYPYGWHLTIDEMRISETKGLADFRAGEGRVACIRIEWEEEA